MPQRGILHTPQAFFTAAPRLLHPRTTGSNIPLSMSQGYSKSPEGRKNSGRWWSGRAAEPLQCRKKTTRAQGFIPGVEMYKYPNPDERRGGILSRRSTKCEDGNAHASICSIAFPSSGSRPSVFAKATPRRVATALCHPTIRWGSVCFFAIPLGFVRVAHSTQGYHVPPRHAARLLIWLA